MPPDRKRRKRIKAIILLRQQKWAILLGTPKRILDGLPSCRNRMARFFKIKGYYCLKNPQNIFQKSYVNVPIIEVNLLSNKF